MQGIALSILLGLIAAGPADSPAVPFPETNPDSALALKLDALGGSPLSLDDALRLAADGATEVREAGLALLAAEGAVRRERGAFDPELYAEFTKSSSDAPTASPFAGAEVVETRQTDASAGARVRLPFGTEIDASLTGSRETTNSTFTALDPQYSSTGLLTVRQPLLSGFGPSARRGLTAAEKARESAQARYNDAVLGVEAEVEATYWNLYAAERDLAALQVVRDRAAALLREAQLREQAGLVGPNQTANARVFLAQQDLAVLDGEERLDAVSDRLASLIGARPADGAVRYHPVDDPPRYDTAEPVDGMVEEALRTNYQLIAARLDVEQLDALARAAGWDALPNLDLVGSYASAGLAGTRQDLVLFGDTLQVGREGAFGETWRQIRGFDYPSWSVGLRFSYPIGTRSARGERTRLTAEADLARERYTDAARRLEEAVRAAHRELRNGGTRMAAAREAVDASQEQVRIGVIEYRNGRSTAFELVRLGADLAAAEQSYSEALVKTARAAATLRQLTSGSYPARIAR